MAEPTIDLADSLPPEPSAEVRVIRSRKRKRTVSARFVDGVLEVSIPAWMSRAEEHRWVQDMAARFAKANRHTDIDLSGRARTLARALDLPRPASIRWVGDMKSRWGSCTIDTGAVRVSDRLSSAPSWVLDYVLVHEMAHLLHASHSAEFWAVVHRYPRAERAIGYLMGTGLCEDGPDGPDDADAGDPPLPG